MFMCTNELITDQLPLASFFYHNPNRLRAQTAEAIYS